MLAVVGVVGGAVVRVIAALLVYVAAALPASAVTVLAVDVPASDPILIPDSFVTSQSATRGAGLSAPTFQSIDGFSAVGFTEADAAGAVADDDYLGFAFESAQAYDLTRLRFGIQRFSGFFGGGPTAGFVRASADGGAFFDVTTADFGISDAGGVVDLALAGIAALQDVTGVEFRIYGYGGSPGFFNPAGEDGGIVRDQLIPGDDLALLLEGELTPPAVVPLPPGLPLLLAGLGALAVLRRRAA
jgi:hypothetical protein